MAGSWLARPAPVCDCERCSPRSVASRCRRCPRCREVPDPQRNMATSWRSSARQSPDRLAEGLKVRVVESVNEVADDIEVSGLGTRTDAADLGTKLGRTLFRGARQQLDDDPLPDREFFRNGEENPRLRHV